MNIFKEYTENQKRAKDKIKREREADKEKHDRMMDQARTRDTRLKNSMSESAQDPDIKDREGTQPAAYHKGLKKTTKAKRDAHFKKHGKKADDDASAYKDAPGDKKARKENMPKSKYTKFVADMMKEKYRPPTEAEIAADKKKDPKAGGDRYKSIKKKVYGGAMGGLKKEGTDFAAHRAKPKLTSSDQKKMAKVADMLRKEREKKAAMKEGVEQVNETEIHFNADDKNNSRSASAFVKHLASKGIQSQKAGGSMHRSIVKVTSKDRAHHDYAKKKVAGRYDASVHKEEAEQADEAYKTPEEAGAFEAGKKAARDGKKADGNPHKDGSLKTAWLKGHNKARARKMGMKEEAEQADENYRAARAQSNAANKMYGRTSDSAVKKKVVSKADLFKALDKKYGDPKKKTGIYAKEEVELDEGYKVPRNYAQLIAKKKKSVNLKTDVPQNTGPKLSDAAKKKLRNIAKPTNMSNMKKSIGVGSRMEDVEQVEAMSKVSEEADKSLAAKAAKSGISVGTLKKVYNRGVAAWKTGHRPGTTPSQWGHARVNAFITKKKKGGLNHDKDLA